ncbi:hypothetical protein L6452_44027 [Arctium lappa]|uniref:Uncharacterized protein n=1 Tax=Arctium lappa TaxID=4217 RepID=A0ACB8XEN4_ARCLA|nr:hypothetical protein L6452_44027 [Arctium lappa]
MGETHYTNEFYLKSMYLDVHSLEQHPEGPAHLKTTSQALLQMAECPAIVPMALSQGHNRATRTTHGTSQVIVPGDCAKGTIAMSQSRPLPPSRYNSCDGARRLCQGTIAMAQSRPLPSTPKLDFSKVR